MNVFITHKIVALSAVLLLSLLGLIIFPGNQVERWTLLLMATTIFGYSHYLLGWFYQVKSFKYKASPNRYYGCFAILLILSSLGSLAFFGLGSVGVFAFVTLGYFMLHGFFNEITLYERQTGKPANRLTVLAVTLGFLGLILNSIGHASWFFDAKLQFIALTDGALATYLQESILANVGRTLGLVSVVAAIAIELFVIHNATSYKRAHGALLFVLFLALAATIFLHPLHYIFLLSGLLLYHFLVWFIFFYDQFKLKGRRELLFYLGIHILVFLPFMFAWSETAIGEFVQTYLLNSYTFLALTTIHISTSFMSERWFQQVFLNRD